MSASLDTRVTPARPDLADVRLRGRVAAERYVAGSERRVHAPSAALRRAPRPDAALETEALMGEAVRVFEERDGFAWAQLADGYVGYLDASALGDPEPAPTHRVSALRSFVYPGPNLKLPPSACLGLGAAVSVAGEEGTYAHLGSGGFVHHGHLVGIDAPAPDFVAVAERLVGTPYLWGGRTSLGLDCSGLVQLALLMAGLPAPRDADQQRAGLGRPLAPDAPLARGDLVFWSGHVGIMRDPRELLHANGHHMEVATEPLAVAGARIVATSYGPIVDRRRLPRLGAG